MLLGVSHHASPYILCSITSRRGCISDTRTAHVCRRLPPAPAAPPELLRLHYTPRGCCRFADRVDWMCIALGAIGAAASGAAMPMFSILFGDL